MSLHMHREMKKINRFALEMCAHVEANVLDATTAFLDRDVAMTQKVIEADRVIDRMEMELAEDCLKILALYHPLARDLRFIFSLAKISGLLERVGDLAENLARKGRSLADKDPVAIPEAFPAMAAQARLMLRNSIDSLVAGDPTQARAVIQSDARVNQGKRVIRKAAEAAILASPSTCSQWLVIIAASRNVERMADMAANIAAEVVYSIDGRVIRHGFDCDANLA